MTNAVVHHQIALLELREIPMVAIVDRHNDSGLLSDVLLLRLTLDHVFSFRQSGSRKVAIQNLKLSTLAQHLLQKLEIYVYYVIVEPGTMIDASQRLVIEYNHRLKTSLLDLGRALLLLSPYAAHLHVVLKANQRKLRSLSSVLQLQMLLNISTILSVICPLHRFSNFLTYRRSVAIRIVFDALLLRRSKLSIRYTHSFDSVIEFSYLIDYLLLLRYEIRRL